VTIRAFSEITDSVVMSNVRIENGCLISESVVGEGSVIRSNFVSDAGEAYVRIDDELHHLPKIGAIVGEDCIIGSNVSVEAGKIIGSQCRISSSKRICANIKDKSSVI
jgi:NDP-sugar pyrophosphorylase family protein